MPLDLQKRKSDVSPMKDSFELAEIERMHIIKVLQYTNGNKTETARLLKIGLATLYVTILFSALTRMFPKPTFAP